jgi:hypothetical protein
MAVAPFIRPIQIQGGTFYTFPSASEDLGFTFNNDGKQFKFSKYALLNIPDIKRPAEGPLNYENYLQLDAIPGAFQYVVNSKTQNLMLAESLQNYALNLETMVTSYPTYDPNDLHSVSERVFFKWLKNIGALRFREASTAESPLTAGLRFTEEVSSSVYSRVVQYIGEIDVVNSVKNKADAFSEVYVHVPTKDGATPLVLFKSLSDANYFANQNIPNAPADPANTEYLYGRNSLQENPAGLATQAFFDSDFQTYGATVGATAGGLPPISTPGEYQLLKYDPSTSNFIVDWWFPFPEANSYWTDPPAITGTFDDPRNDSFMIRGVKQGSGSSQDIFFQRSRLDGISLDFETQSYYPIASNPAIKSFSDFNSLPETVSFEFNTVLIYYDIIDVSTGNRATNLFGVLFLDNVEDTLSGGGYIPRLKKFKPNRITGLNGNSYGFKINLKFDINTEDAAIVTAVNEYAPFSMQLFVDALNELQQAADTLTNNTNEVERLRLEVLALQDLVYNGTDLNELDQRVSNIETMLQTSQANLENSQTLVELIQRNYDEILNIYNNKTSVTVSYNTDVLQEGDGIVLDRSTPNLLVVKNVEQGYTIDTSPLYNVVTGFTITPSAWVKFTPLKKFGNYFKISNGSVVTFDRDVYIYVDDSQFRWSAGQTYKVVVDHVYPMDMYSQGSFDLVVYTDALDRLNTGQNYSKEIGRISSSEFYAKGGAPQIEIICIDRNSYTFTFDLL